VTPISLPIIPRRRAAVFLVAVLAVLAPAPAAVLAAAPDAAVIGPPRVELLAADAASTTLRFVFPVDVEPADWATRDPSRVTWRRGGLVVRGEGDALEALPPEARALIAVPTRTRPSLTVVSRRWLRPPRDGESVTATLDGPALSRDLPLVSIAVAGLSAGGGILGEAVVVVSHPPDPSYAALLAAAAGEPYRLTADAAAPRRDVSGAINGGLAVDLRAGARALAGRRPDAMRRAPSDHPFSLTSRWLRLEIAETGVYRLTGYDMNLAGVSGSGVDPAKLRLYRAEPRPLDADPEASGSWQDGWTGLAETALLLDEDDGSWDSGDALLFYALGPDGWTDRIDPAAGRLDHHEHPYADRLVYWLTWEDAQTASPLPGAPLRLGSRDATGGAAEPVAMHLDRMHFEESRSEAFGRVADDWAWDAAIFTQKSIALPVTRLVTDLPDRSAFWQIDMRSTVAHIHESTDYNSARAWLNSGVGPGELVEKDWLLGAEASADSQRFRLSAWSDLLVEGMNTLTLQRASPDTSPPFLLDCCDLLCWRWLAVEAGAQLPFVHWGEQVATAGEEVRLRLIDIGGGGLSCWDVSDALAPAALAGEAGAGTLELSLLRDPGVDVHMVAFRDSELPVPASVSRRTPTDLRAMSETAIDYVVLYDQRFRSAALQLASFRDAMLPGRSDPRATAVDQQDVFDCFGGGVKDPYALRNFLKWLYLHSGPELDRRLGYVCLVGDASRDYRLHRNQFEDFVPTVVRNSFPRLLNTYTYEPYATDDELVSFDVRDFGQLDLPDLAVGRLTARSLSDALAQVERIVGYAAAPEPGDWRNRIVLAADDLNTPRGRRDETFHILQAETLADFYLPPTLDVGKIYLTEYGSNESSSPKPLARLAAKENWSDGLTLFHYIGHGADNTLADEQLFTTDDIYGLTNAGKRGVFLAFSCDVGIFDHALRQSMAETFVNQAGGAAIAAIAASQVSWVYQNNAFSNDFYEALYPGRNVVDGITLGEALLTAKVMAGSDFNLANAERYMLFGDPALALPQPVGGLVLHDSSSDELASGGRAIAVAALAESGFAGWGSSYDLRVEDAREQVHFVGPDGDIVDYWIPGDATFRGVGPVDADTLRVPFKLPVQMRYGPHARMRLIIDGQDGSRAGTVDLPAILVSVEDADVRGPDIRLAFADGSFRVKSGTPLNAEVGDSSGVNILGTLPSNSILLEFDDSGFTTEVTDRFVFDAGSFERGRLQIPLPDNLAIGRHTAALFASDLLGNVGSDTLSFQLVAATVSAIDDVTVFPNPTPGPARLVFELSDPMDVRWDLYTVSGRRVFSMERGFATAGPKILEWDGRDAAGDPLANGVYLFVLRGSWAGDGGHDLVETGQLVIMK